MGIRDIEVKWDGLKEIANERSLSFHYVDLGNTYHLQVFDSVFQIFCRIMKSDPKNDEQIDFEDNYKSKSNPTITVKSGELPTVSSNRIPFGYSACAIGNSDDIVTGMYGGGEDLFLDKDKLSAKFYCLNHWYIIGAEASWSVKSKNRDYLYAALYASATIGTEGTGFNFTKVPTGLGFNVYVPTPQGQGNWNLDLVNPKFSGKEMLKVTPVPVAGNTGFFDYHSDTNTMTVNSQQKGGYNLYDVNLPVFSFARSYWGTSGCRVEMKTDDLVGKKIYANWYLKFDINIHDAANRVTDDVSVGVTLTAGMKKNL
jgi:hypothetical protein